jgi:hypothetical protein
VQATPYEDVLALLRDATWPSEKDAKSAQKLGQLQSFLAVFPQECTGQLAVFGLT